MNIITKVVVVFVFLGSAHPASPHNLEFVVNKVSQAYGGSKLTELKSIQINEKYQLSWHLQGYTEQFSEYAPVHRIAYLDLQKELGSMEEWTSRWGYFANNRRVSLDNQIINIDYFAHTFQPNAFANFDAAFTPVFRHSDTLLARALLQQKSQARYLSNTQYLGVTHHLMSLNIAGMGNVTLWIADDTGFVSLMQRQPTTRRYSYVFSNHQKSPQGITYAKGFAFYINDKTNSVITERHVIFNQSDNGFFTLDEGIQEEPQRIVANKMQMQKIDDTTYLVGLGNAFSLFVVEKDHLTGSGGYAGLQQRLDYFRKQTGNTLPLKYQVVTHHHGDHLEGLDDAIRAGATLVIPNTAVQAVTNFVTEPLPKTRVLTVTAPIDLGSVKLLLVSTSHSVNNAVLYLPASKTLFEADHYHGKYTHKVNHPTQSAFTFFQAVNKLDLDIKSLLSAHSGKIENWQAFAKKASNYKDIQCPMKRKICQ